METNFIALLIASTVVGCLIGAVGIGGILLIPALIALAGLSPHQASATALFTFLFTGVLGSILFQRQGSIDWRQTLTVCAGAVVFSYLGAMANSAVDGVLLMRIIAALIIFAGVYVFLPRPAEEEPASKPFRLWLLLLIGAAAGFGSGFSGAGGPLFSVPLMVLWGFAPLSAIGTSQVLQIFSAAAGTLANLHYGEIQWAVAGWITLFELAGVVAGARLAHVVSADVLKRVAGAVCVLVGIYVLVRT